MFILRKGEEQDLDQIMGIIAAAVAILPQPDLFVPDDRECLARHLRDEGFFVVAQTDGGLAAYLQVRFPGTAEDNLSRDAGLPEEAVLHCAHMESVAVLPEFRGQGLQKLLLTYGEKLLPEQIGWVLATVSPKNSASLRSFLSLGYQIMITKEKYGGKLRHILLKELPGRP